MSPKLDSSAETHNIIQKLKKYKESANGGSWDDIGERLSIHKRTILRWIKTGKMSYAYRRLVSGLLKDVDL